MAWLVFVGGLAGCGAEPISAPDSSDSSDTGEWFVLGNDYTFSLAEMTWIEPAGLAEVLTAYWLPDGDPLLRVQSVESSTISFRAAVSEGDDPASQDPCVLTDDFEATWARPAFESTGPFRLPYPSGTEGPVVQLQDGVFSGRFSIDGQQIEELALSGFVDTAPVVPLLDADAEPDFLCVMAAEVGGACVSCPDGGQTCLEVVLVDGTAQVTGTEVSEVSEVDPSCP